MKGIIIAGGAGTRLRPLTYTRPKPLIPVVNRPFLEYQVALLKRHGITEIIFCTNYLADQIEGHFGNGSAFGVSMQYALEEAPLGTAGAIKNAQALAGRDSLVVLNGDVLTDFDISSIIRFHKEKNALVTLTLKEVPSPSPYGVIITDANGRVQEFREPSEAQKKALASNPNIQYTGVDYINAGIYVMEPEALDAIPTGKPVSIERETYPKLLAEGAPIYAIAREGYWLDIGRPEQYRQATEAILSRDIAVDVPGEWMVSGYWAEEGAEVDPTAHIAPTVHIGKKARIAAGATIKGKTVIGPRCQIGANATLIDCILEDSVIIGEGAKLCGAILDNGAHVAAESVVTIPSVFAAGSVLGKGTRITNGHVDLNGNGNH
jgi:mannose-1-phosphate guanylyltransferase/phosphomannomutase